MLLVPDSSAILSIAFDDEDATYGTAVIRAIGTDEAIVPTLFWFEIRNVLLIGERRKRITAAKTTSFLADLAILPITVDASPVEKDVMEMARKYSLTVYDAAYLELSLRMSLPLASMDNALLDAAKRAGVKAFSAKGR